MKDLFEAVRFLKRSGQAEIRRLARAGRGVLDASLRFEVVLRRGSSAENGAPRRSSEQESAALGLSVIVGGRAQAIGYGYSGVEVGHAALKPARIVAAIRPAFKAAFERAQFNARQSAQLLRQYGAGARPSGFPPLLCKPKFRRRALAIRARLRPARSLSSCWSRPRHWRSSAAIFATTWSPPSPNCARSFSKRRRNAHLPGLRGHAGRLLRGRAMR